MEQTLKKDLISRIKSLSNPLLPDETGVPPDLNKLDDIKAVVFDVYGTLFISGTGDISLADDHDSSAAIESALKSVGFEINIDRIAEQVSELYDKAVKQFMKDRKQEGIDFPEVDIVTIWFEVLNTLKETEIINGMISDKTVRQFAVEYECRANPIWPMPDLKRTLQEIKNSGFDLGIVSNSQFYTPLMFDAMLNKSISELGFKSQLCTWSYQHLIGKPSLMLYEKLLDSMEQNVDYTPEQVLYVGNDMLKDVYPADKLGFRTAFFTGDSRSYKPREDDARCKDVKPSVRLSKLKQVLDCI